MMLQLIKIDNPTLLSNLCCIVQSFPITITLWHSLYISVCLSDYICLSFYVSACIPALAKLCHEDIHYVYSFFLLRFLEGKQEGKNHK